MYYTKSIFIAACFSIISIHSIAQTNFDTAKKLPFHISNLKKLDADELKDKKEGTTLTGLPRLSSDPLNGLGYGFEGALLFNGKRSDPFFEYTPYRCKLGIDASNTSKSERKLAFNYDRPYFLNSKWRFRGEVAYEKNPNLIYFGTTHKSLNTLDKIATEDSISFSGKDYNSYNNSLTGKNENYNGYTKEEYIINLSGEYSLFDSRMRVLAGYEIAWMDITAGANSRLSKDAAAGQIVGLGKSVITFIQSGIVWDTRNFESDPDKGTYAEITNEISSKALGSKFNCDKVFAQYMLYKKILPEVFGKTILASRFGIGYTFGNAPFFEYQDEWASQGSIEGLGGSNTLRGYKQSRFLDRGMYFFNIELRSRFAQVNILKQHLAFSIVPFFDAGSVYNKIADLTNTVKYSEGLGLRIAWNISTILRFDYANSKEDKQFFFTFDHCF